MIICDTSGVIAALFPDQHHHGPCATVLRTDPGPFVLSPFVAAEVDYLIASFGTTNDEIAWLRDVGRGAYELAAMTAADVDEAASVVEQYSDQGIGLADSSIVVLSRRLRTTRVLTLDERHFRVLTGYRGQPFTLVAQDG